MIKNKMSANNYILIDRNTFQVSMRDADIDYAFRNLGKGKNLEEAIDIAQEYQDIVEYGINFTGRKKKNVK